MGAIRPEDSGAELKANAFCAINRTAKPKSPVFMGVDPLDILRTSYRQNEVKHSQ